MELDSEVRIVPANRASWEELQQVFGTRGAAAHCWCQRYKLQPKESFGGTPVAEREQRLQTETAAGHPDAPSTTGLVAFVDGVPAGWCAVQPRADYRGLLRVYKIPWADRHEDKGDPGVWALTCFVVRAGYRGRGISYHLAAAAVDFARGRGATALEGYPIAAAEGQKVTWGDEHVGFSQVFAAAGFTEVSRPGVQRVVMRIDFQDRTAPGAG